MERGKRRHNHASRIGSLLHHKRLNVQQVFKLIFERSSTSSSCERVTLRPAVLQARSNKSAPVWLLAMSADSFAPPPGHFGRGPFFRARCARRLPNPRLLCLVDSSVMALRFLFAASSSR